MTWMNLIGMAFRSWRQQKTRLILTTLGVVFGTTVLMVSLGLRQGIQATIVRQYQRFGKLREISVTPIREPRKAPPVQIEGAMNEERRERLRREYARRSISHDIGEREPKVPLTAELLDELRQIEHVVDVQGTIAGQVRVIPLVDRGSRDSKQTSNLLFRKKSSLASLVALRKDDERIAKRLIQGETFAANDAHQIIVSEYLLYQLGVRNANGFEKAIGAKVKLDFRSHEQTRSTFWEELRRMDPETTRTLETSVRKILRSLFPPKKITRPRERPIDEFTICGILSSGAPPPRRFSVFQLDPGFDVLLPEKTAIRLYLQHPLKRRQGLYHATVEVDDVNNVKAVEKKLKAKGLNTSTLLKAIEREQFSYTLITDSMTVIAIVALLVAGLGIINTMFMSVLERTREIGILKAIGASRGHIQSIFLVEGMVVGFIGGVLGMLAGWGISIPADVWVRSNVEKQLNIKLEQSIFLFPWWLLLVVWATALVVTTGAAWFPARRAAKVDPIRALRGE